MNIYKIKYQWVEDDTDEHYVFSNLNQKDFESLLLAAVEEINKNNTEENDYLPDAYRRLIDYLQKNPTDNCYIGKYYKFNDTYYLDDRMKEDRTMFFYINKQENLTKWTELGDIHDKSEEKESKGV